MAIELHGENFQSWERFDLKLDGLTVVVGPSNHGKSAIFRALKGLVRNTLNAGQIRFGSEGIKIEAVIDGHSIIALRPKKGSVSYQVDGEDYQKLDGAIPEKVAELGMGELVIGKIKLDPVFAPQFGRQFVLEETDGPLNTILGAFSSTERLEFGKRSANLRIGEKNTEAKLLAKDMRVVEERKARLEPLAVQAAQIQTAIDASEHRVDHYERTVAELDALLVHLTRLNRLKAVIDGIEVPDTAPVAQGIGIVQASEQAARIKQQHQRTLSTLERLRVPETEQAHLLFEKMLYSGRATAAHITLTNATAATKVIVTVVEGWRGIAALHKRGKAVGEAEQALLTFSSSRAKEFVARLDGHNSNIAALFQEGNRLSTGIKTLGALVETRAQLSAHRTELLTVEAESGQAQTKLEEIAAALQTHQQEQAVAAAKAKIKLCPKCGEPI